MRVAGGAAGVPQRKPARAGRCVLGARPRRWEKFRTGSSEGGFGKYVNPDPQPLEPYFVVAPASRRPKPVALPCRTTLRPLAGTAGRARALPGSAATAGAVE